MSEKPVKVLLLAYNFPPFIRAASLRTYSWYYEFSDQIDVTVVTRKWEKGVIYNRENYFKEDSKGVESHEESTNKRIYYIPNEYNRFFRLKNSTFIKRTNLNKLFTFIELLFKWNSFDFLDNERSLYRNARKLLKEQNFDLIICSGEPFILFKYCYLLNKEFNVPYFLDYRDAWTGNFSKTDSKNPIIKLINQIQSKAEKKYTLKASKLIFVSDKLGDDVLRNLNFDKSSMILINNGIDLSTYNIEKEIIDKNKWFEISFIGTLYPQHNLDYLLVSLSNILKKDQSKKIKVHFVGSLINCPIEHELKLKKFQTEFPENIIITPYADYQKSIQIQICSAILVKFNALNQQTNHFGKKLYEYAASGKKVLSINSFKNQQHSADFFSDKPFQYFCDSQVDVENFILDFYTKWLSGEKLINNISISELLPFSSTRQTQKLEEKIIEFVRINRNI